MFKQVLLTVLKTSCGRKSYLLRCLALISYIIQTGTLVRVKFNIEMPDLIRSLRKRLYTANSCDAYGHVALRGGIGEEITPFLSVTKVQKMSLDSIGLIANYYDLSPFNFELSP